MIRAVPTINTMANEHPFQMLFETLGRISGAHAESVNRQAYGVLFDVLSVPVEKPGRCILLRAPRAGHGKTHLLSRIQHHLGASHEFIPLHPSFGCQVDAASVIDDALRRLLHPLPASGGLCKLDLVTRRLFASALQPLVGSGEVPCQDREGALAALRTRPIETFDFHHPNAVTAHWARENFEVLGQRLSMELAQRSDLPIREVAFWVDALFLFAATPVENPERLRTLVEVVHAGNPGEGVLMERLEALLGMLAQLMRVVLVADDLEGFSADETAALKLAAFLGVLRQSVERLDVILSMNQDIWQSAFVPRLSDGLADRLSEVVVELTPLTEEEMEALLESRVPGLGERVLSRVDRAAAGTHARGLIRAAGVAWLRATSMDAQGVAAPSTSVVVPEPNASLIHGSGSVPFPEPVVPPTLAASPTVSHPDPSPPPAAAMAGVVDPTLAIAFLAASADKGKADNLGSPPAFALDPAIEAPPSLPVAEALQDSSFQTAVSAAAAAPKIPLPPEVSVAFTSEFQATPPASPEPMVWSPVVESPFQAVVEPIAATAVTDAPPSTLDSGTAQGEASLPAGEPESQTVDRQAPQPPVETPAFQPVPEPVAAPATPAEIPAFKPTPIPDFQPVQNPVPPAVLDTDRVDDLLRQFRERYGRGSM